MMKCLECGLHWTPLGGAGGQMMPECPVCTLRFRLAEAERERDGAVIAAKRWAATEEQQRARAEQAEAALSDTVHHLRNLLAVVKGELGGMADCCDVNDAGAVLDRLATPNTTKPTTEDPT